MTRKLDAAQEGAARVLSTDEILAIVRARAAG